MKKLLKSLAFWILKIQKVNTYTYIEDRLLNLANGKAYSFYVQKTVTYYKGETNTNKVKYYIYIDGCKFHSDSDLEEAFKSLENELNPVSIEPKEIHI